MLLPPVMFLLIKILRISKTRALPMQWWLDWSLSMDSTPLSWAALPTASLAGAVRMSKFELIIMSRKLLIEVMVNNG